jgi:DNA modification methylase
MPPINKPKTGVNPFITWYGKDWMLYHGDCRKVLPTLANPYDLVFADPPFNIGHPYEGYEDAMPIAEYNAFTREWLCAAVNVLRPGGTLCLHVPDELAKFILAVSYASKFPPIKQVDWIIWHYRFGQSGNAAKSSRCINSKAHLLVFVKEGGTRTWNPPMVPSDRATVYGDERTAASATPGERVALDVWGVPSDGPNWGRVQGNNGERWDRKHGALADHPNQLPEVYVARALRAYSNPGDRVCCPFGGSGTEAVVALALGRRVAAVEFSEVNCRSIVKRIERGAIRV